MSVRSLVFGKIMTTCCPNRLLFYNTNIRHSIITQTSIIQFHFIHTIKTTRQPFNHHTFCTPLTRHQHCSVNMVFTTPIIQFSTVIGFKIPFHHQNPFKIGFNLIYIVIKNHSILPYHFPIPSLQHSNSIPSFQHSKGHQKRCFVLIVSLFQSLCLFSIIPTTFTTSKPQPLPDSSSMFSLWNHLMSLLFDVSTIPLLYRLKSPLLHRSKPSTVSNLHYFTVPKPPCLQNHFISNNQH